MATTKEVNRAMISREPRAKLTRDIIRQSEFRALNLSAGGIAMETTIGVQQHEIIELELDIEGTVQQVKGVVRWCESIHPVFASHMRCGLEFIEAKASEIIQRRDFVTKLRGTAETPQTGLTGTKFV